MNDVLSILVPRRDIRIECDDRYDYDWSGSNAESPPRVIFFLLAALRLVSALLAGYAMCSTAFRSWFCMLLFAPTISVAFFVILDLEYPRFGLIRVDEADQMFVELRNLMR